MGLSSNNKHIIIINSNDKKNKISNIKKLPIVNNIVNYYIDLL